MTCKKYELTTETKVVLGRTLHRIRALVAFGNVAAGELGGWIETEGNLAQSGNAWVYDDAEVCGYARVSGCAKVFENAKVSGCARVFLNARVSGNARVFGYAKVSGNARVYDNAIVYGKARIYGDARVGSKAEVSGNAKVFGKAWLSGNAEVWKHDHLLMIGAIGSRGIVTTFYRTKDNQIHTTAICFDGSCCFEGTIAELAKKIEQLYVGSKHAKTYALAIELAKAQIEDVIK